MTAPKTVPTQDKKPVRYRSAELLKVGVGYVCYSCKRSLQKADFGSTEAMLVIGNRGYQATLEHCPDCGPQQGSVKEVGKHDK